MKRFYKLLVLAFLAFLASSASAYDFKEGGLCYYVNPDGVSVTVTYERWVNSQPSYANLNGPLIIPDTVRNKAVTAIGPRAFCDCSNLTSVTLPNTIINASSG